MAPNARSIGGSNIQTHRLAFCSSQIATTELAHSPYPWVSPFCQYCSHEQGFWVGCCMYLLLFWRYWLYLLNASAGVCCRVDMVLARLPLLTMSQHLEQTLHDLNRLCFAGRTTVF